MHVGSANFRITVGGDADADPGAADENAFVGTTVPNGFRQGVSEIRVIHGFEAVCAEIENFITRIRQISLQDSLESIGSQMEKEKFRVVILDLKARIEGGQSFSQALAEHPDVFTNLYINMIAAAEISGSMSSISGIKRSRYSRITARFS